MFYRFIFLSLCFFFINSEAGYTKYFATVSDIREMCYGLRRFSYDTGRFPTTYEGIDILLDSKGISGWNGPYLKRKFPQDAWLNKFNYHNPAKYGNYQYDLYSNGENKKDDFGNEDDITNWKLLDINSCELRR